MTVLEKIAAYENVVGLDKRVKPAGSEYWPLIGWYLAAKHKEEGKPNILDSSTVKPLYFFTGWAIHLPFLIVGLSYLAHSFKL